MKKVIPFTKEITFDTMISKITDISIEHTLRVCEDNLISGFFIIEGKYKMTPASQIDEEFSYKIPVDVEIDNIYDISSISIDIDNFTYDVVEDEKLIVNIDLCIDNINEKDVRNDQIEVIDDLFLESSKPVEFEVEKEENAQYDSVTNTFNYIDEDKPKVIKLDSSNDDKTNSLFASFKESAETFKAYYVYIVKEEDTLDSIISKYGTDKELLEEYNDLSNISTGSKIIIPSLKNEQL